MLHYRVKQKKKGNAKVLETNLAGNPANLAIVTNTVVNSEHVPSRILFRNSKVISASTGAPLPL